jgi:hypothetical protein
VDATAIVSMRVRVRVRDWVALLLLLLFSSYLSLGFSDVRFGALALFYGKNGR